MKREAMTTREKEMHDMREPKPRHRTEMEKLVTGLLSKVRSRSGSMQSLATQDVYYLRKIVAIVALLQFQNRMLKDHSNLSARKIRRLQHLVKAQRSCIDAMQSAVDAHCNVSPPEKPVPSTVKGFDL